jgi:choline dehydrogenase-like flavoprotein
MQRPNLAVELNALTTRVLTAAGRATCVEYSKGGQLFQVRAAREVILSGGTYNSPQQHRLFAGVVLLHAKSRGFLTLRSPSPTDAPRITTNLFAEKASDMILGRAQLPAAKLQSP